MTTYTATVTTQGTFECGRCSKPLRGYDALFDVCNDCALILIAPLATGDDDDDDDSGPPTSPPIQGPVLPPTSHHRYTGNRVAHTAHN